MTHPAVVVRVAQEAERRLDRDAGVEAMQLVQVDAVESEASQAAVQRVTMKLLGTIVNRFDCAGMYYRNSSAITHAALHGLVKRLEIRDGEDSRYRARLRELTATEAAVEIQLALATLQVAGRALLTQTGSSRLSVVALA